MGKVTFSVDEYDRDGFCTEGIFLHFGDVKVKVANNVDSFQTFIENLQKMKTEIIENY